MGRKRAIVPKPKELNGQLTCWANGKREYFGKFGTPEAEAKFRSFVALYATNPNATAKDVGGILAHLIGEYLQSPDAPRPADKQRAVAYLINHLGELALRPVEHVTAQDLKALFKAKAEATRDVKGVRARWKRSTARRRFGGGSPT